MSSSSVAFGWSSRNLVALTTSARLWGAKLVAMPTAIPLAPFTSKFGIAEGSTMGSISRPS